MRRVVVTGMGAITPIGRSCGEYSCRCNKKSDSGCRQVQKQQQLRGFLYGGVRDYSSSVCE